LHPKGGLIILDRRFYLGVGEPGVKGCHVEVAKETQLILLVLRALFSRMNVGDRLCFRKENGALVGSREKP
jgi:hypothetical protein